MAVADEERVIRAAPRTTLHELGTAPNLVLKHTLTSADPEAAEALRRQARALSTLSHPGLLRPSTVSEGPTGPIVVYPNFAAPGTIVPLDEARSSRGPIDPSVAVLILTPVAGGLAAAHQRGLFHGHLEPSCVLLAPAGVKLSDFLVGTGRPLLRPGPASASGDLAALLQLHAWILGKERSPWEGRVDSVEALADAWAQQAQLLEPELLPRWLAMSHRRSLIPPAETMPRSVPGIPEETVLRDHRAELDSGRIGTVIDGRYRLIEKIGSGGMGTIYRAEQLNVGREVALKLLRPPGGEEERAEALTRFENEARAVAQLKHPNTVHLYDFGRQGNGELYLVTELLRGHTLAEELESGTLSTTKALRFIAEIADALAEAHQKGVVHRDVTPRNIFLDQLPDRQSAKLLDFGVARLSGGATATRAGQAIGTPTYMSPEQATGLPATPSSDLYSLGATLFECLSGRPPFSAPTVSALLAKQVDEPAPLLSEVAPHLQGYRELEALVASLLAKRPQERPPSAAALRDQLQRQLERMTRPGVSNNEAPVLGPYRLGPVLGSTPTSEVYRATDTRDGRQVAVKVLTDRALGSPTAVARLKREAQGLGRLHHPHIVEFLDHGLTPDGRAFLVTELLPGRTVRERLLAEGPFDAEQAAAIVGQIAEALAYAHGIGVIHRDLKPGNVMLLSEHPRPRVKLIDFGLIKWNDEASRTTLTRRDALLGTPAYVAPEQIYDASEITPSADLYSLGCVLYALLSARPPFTGAVDEVLKAHYVTEPPLPPPSKGLELLVAPLMAKLPGQRPGSAQEVLARLAELGFRWDAPTEPSSTSESLGPTISRTPALMPTRPSAAPLTPPDRSTPWLYGLSLLVLAGTLALLLPVLLRSRAEPEFTRTTTLPPASPAIPPETVAPTPEPSPAAVIEPVAKVTVVRPLPPPTPPPRGPVRAPAPEPATNPRTPSGAWVALEARQHAIAAKEGAANAELVELPACRGLGAARRAQDLEAYQGRLAACESASEDGSLAAALARTRIDRLGRRLGELKDTLGRDELSRFQRRFFDLGGRLTRAAAIADRRGIAEEAAAVLAEVEAEHRRGAE